MTDWKQALRLSFRVIYPYIIYVCVASLFYTWGEVMHQEQAIVMLEGAAASSLILLYFYRKERTMGIPKVSISLQAGVLSAALCLFLNLLLLSGVSDETSKEIYQSQFVIQILTAGIAIPAAEELVFRGMGFLRLRESMNFFPAALFSSIMFGIYHGEMIQGVYAGVMGFLFAWLAEKGKGVFLPMLGHMAANLCSLFFTISGEAWWLMEKMSRRGLGGVFLAAIVFFFIRQKKKGRE